MEESEVWKPVVGFEERYEVSNLGNVRSISTAIPRRGRWGGIVVYHRSGRPMVASRCTNNYLFVSLVARDGSTKRKLVHRIVAEAFLPNPNKYPAVNHKDESRDNNRVDNLEWCNHSYNNRYGKHREKTVETMRKNRKDRWHPKFVLQYSTNEELLAVYPSIIEAHRKTGCDAKNIWLSAMKRKNGEPILRNRAKFLWGILDVESLPKEYEPYLVK